jgi:SAM-dependent methyltransferase
MGNLGGAVIVAQAAIGDRLGLFKTLATGGPATSSELAARAAIDERYAREWLSSMAAAGYVTYDPASMRFGLPTEHAMVLAHEDGPAFLAGYLQGTMGHLAMIDRVTDAFRTGRGVPASEYGADTWDGVERMSGPIYVNALVPQLIAAIPDVQAKLERGAHLADVGCGRGRAVVELAQAFPKSTFAGYDALESNVAGAVAHAKEAGVADRVQFEVRDIANGLPETFDIVTAFDVIHDTADPKATLAAIHDGLRPGGVLLCLEITAPERLEDALSPMTAALYGVSTFFCMSVSLGAGGVGVGTLGLPESRLREYAEQAGFCSVERAPVEIPFNTLYVIRR